MVPLCVASRGGHDAAFMSKVRGCRTGCLRILVAVIVLGVAGSPALAQDIGFRPSFGFGIGPVFATASSPHRAFDGAGGAGMQLSAEKYFGRRYVWDLRFGGFYTDLESPEEISYPPDDGDWSVLSTGLRYVAFDGPSIDAWIALEASLHYAQMEHFAYVGTGWGLGPALGVDFPVDRGSFLLRLGARASWVDLDADSAPPSRASFVALFGLDLVYRLGDRGQPSGRDIGDASLHPGDR